jgi:hypothetical protein
MQVIEAQYLGQMEPHDHLYIKHERTTRLHAPYRLGRRGDRREFSIRRLSRPRWRRYAETADLLRVYEDLVGGRRKTTPDIAEALEPQADVAAWIERLCGSELITKSRTIHGPIQIGSVIASSRVLWARVGRTLAPRRAQPGRAGTRAGSDPRCSNQSDSPARDAAAAASGRTFGLRARPHR